MSSWQVYLVRCADDSLYAGIATDVRRRVQQHNGELSGGARYTRGRRPVQLVWQDACASRSEALQREAEIKNLTRLEKIALIGE